MMKLRNLLTALTACSAVLSACALPASAAILNPQNDSEKKSYVVDLKQSVKNWKEITGVRITVTPAEDWKSQGGFGGGVIFSGEGAAWDDHKKEFSVNGEGAADKKDQLHTTKEGSSFLLTYDNEAPLFQNAGDSSGWGRLTVQDWWGADFSVDKVEYLYAETAAETTAASAAVTTTSAAVTTTSAAAATTAAVTTTAAPAKTTVSTTTAPAAKTGDAGAGLALAGIALAGTAAYAVRRKH